MTITKLDYAARILGSPDVPVGLSSDTGTIALDVADAPHVTASGITLTMPDPALLTELDPRDGRRLLIEVGGRPFDLGIREVTPDRAGSTVSVDLASDEALLDDFAQLVDDAGPREHEASLRAVCDYVLGKIGAALEPGDADADATAYWAVTNRAINGGLRADAAGWAAGSGTSAATRVTAPTIDGLPSMRFTASGTGNAFLNTPVSGARVTPGEEITVSVRMASATTSRPARVMLRFWNASGGVILDSYSTAVMTSTNAAAPTTVSRTRVVPPGAVSVSAFVNTQVNTAGQNHYVSALFFGSDDVPFFDGATVDPHYTYAWEDAANSSTATRTPLVERDPESLLWRAGDSGLAFLRPLLVAAGLRLVCDEQRRWTLRDSTYRADGAQAYRFGVNILTADERLSRDSDEWFDGMVVPYTWTDRAGIEQTRVDAWALTATPTKVVRREIRAPYPGPGRAEYAVRRAQGKGRTLTASRQARWDEHAEQPITATLDGTPIQTGLAERVVFDIGENTVSVTARTTDTPASAWVLIPAGETWLDSPIGESWTEEII